ncbi:MAG TPA: sigma-70 family RNA polymerase sigma factor [Gemmatimonadales bacterium]|nr:sigma-70 family RNA polymerase sigma factor [Gemmatimonadales bacterium]
MTPRKLDIESKRAEFEATAVPFLQPLYSAARRLADGPDDAADLVQETFLRAYRTFENFTPGTNCKAWLFTILYSVFINEYHRKERRGSTVSLDELERRFQRYLQAPDEAEPAGATESAGSVGPEVDAALRQLPADFRAPVLLVDVEGLSYDEAAAVLGCPIGTVRSRLFRARRILFAALQQYAVKSGFTRGKQ